MICALTCPLISRLISSIITCFVLLGCLGAAGGNGNAAGTMQAVRLNRPFSLRAGQEVTLRGERLRIKFEAVEEDSRCPANVTCVWAGNAAVRLAFSTSHRDRKSLTLNTGKSATLVGERQYRGYKVRLLGLSPYPQSDQKIGARDYVVTLLVRDYKPFAEVAKQVMSGIVNELSTGQLDDHKRVKFYALGAGEGLLLDRANPRWRERYFVDKFYLDKYFDQTK